MDSQSTNTSDVNARSPDDFGTTPSSTSSSSRALEEGEILLDRYRIVSVLGRGAVGTVYRVEQIFLKKHFALKTLNTSVNDKMILRLQKEAQTASKLDHPNLVRAVDFGLIDGIQPFLVMDFIGAETLSVHLKNNGRLSVDRVLEIFIPICFALAYAHQEGIVHRDLKPSNILLVPSDDGSLVPKVVDFGIAKLDDPEAMSLTKTGEIFGTPLYMSPEQCTGARVDNRSDIYALGCVLFEALTGAPPIQADTALETMMLHSSRRAPSLKEGSLGVEFPVPLERIIAKMLSKSPQHRYQNFLAVAADLAALKGGAIIADSEPAVDTAGQPTHSFRSNQVRAVVVAAASLTCAMTAFVLLNPREEPAPAISPSTPGTLDPIDSTYAPQSHDRDFFSRTQGAYRVFDFPTGYNLGELVWWEKSDPLLSPHIVRATGPVSLPTALPVIYLPGGDMLLKTYHSRYFRDKDFDGLVWNPQDAAAVVSDVERVLLDLTLIDSLRQVSTNKPIPESVLANLGRLPDLDWLVLQDPNLAAETVSTLANLNTFRVFGVDRIKSIKPLLPRLLRNRSLERLAVVDAHLTIADVAEVTKIKSLKCLDLSGNPEMFGRGSPSVEQCVTLLAQLKTLPELRVLCIDGRYLCLGEGPPDPSIIKSVAGLRNLRFLALTGNPSIQTFAVSPDGSVTMTKAGRNVSYSAEDRAAKDLLTGSNRTLYSLRPHIPSQCMFFIGPDAFGLKTFFSPEMMDPDCPLLQ